MNEVFDKLVKALECILKIAVSETIDGNGVLPFYEGIPNQIIDLNKQNALDVPCSLPWGPCVYVYLFFSEGAFRPNAIYVGQTTRDVYQRLGEHLRGVRRESDNRMRDLLKEGGMLHVFSVPAAADYLNGLEKAGCNWMNENCINMEIINVTGAGGNHCAKKIDPAKAECAKVYLPRKTQFKNI